MEERDMKYFRNIITFDIEHNAFVKPFEHSNDTDWYSRNKYEAISMTNIKNRLIKENIPKDLVVFDDTFNLKDRTTLNWSSSDGYAHDSDKEVAIQKGISEVIEHHSIMYW